MNILDDREVDVNAGRPELRIFAPDLGPEVLDDLGHQPPPLPTLETAEWIDAQASYYRSRRNDLADLVAGHLDDLAGTWRVISGGRPISVATFLARCEVMEVMDDLASSDRYL